MHIATDTNGISKKVIATTASTHDSTQNVKHRNTGVCVKFMS